MRSIHAAAAAALLISFCPVPSPASAGPAFVRDPETGTGTVIWQAAGGTPEQFTTATAMPHNYVLGISFQDDDIWLATEKGLARGTHSSPRTVRADVNAPRAQSPAPQTEAIGAETERPANDSPARECTEGGQE